MKWLAVIALAIIGVLAAIVAVEYLTVPIHSLPSFIPGGHPGRGHYHKRGAVAAVIAVVALAGAVILAIYFRRLDAARAGGATTVSPPSPGQPVAE